MHLCTIGGEGLLDDTLYTILIHYTLYTILYTIGPYWPGGRAHFLSPAGALVRACSADWGHGVGRVHRYSTTYTMHTILIHYAHYDGCTGTVQHTLCTL
jgi:hypothetical protein